MDHTEKKPCPIGLTKEEITKTFESGIPKKCEGCENFIYEDGIISCRLITD